MMKNFLDCPHFNQVEGNGIDGDDDEFDYCKDCGAVMPQLWPVAQGEAPNPTTPTDNTEWLDRELTEYATTLLEAARTTDYALELKNRRTLKATILTHIDTVCREARIDELRQQYPKLEQGYSGGAFVLRASKIDDRLAQLKEAQLNPNKDTPQ